MDRYGLHGKLTATDGNQDQLTSILLEASELVSDAPGCHLYLISQDKTDPNSVWVTEVWDSKEDHDNSLKDEQVRALIMKALPLLDGKPEKGQELKVLGGTGVN